MKNILAFTLKGCPYCRSAQKAYAALHQKPAYRDVSIDWIDETEHPELASKYDHYYCPSIFVDGQKVYEAHPGDDDDTIFHMVETTLQKAIA